MAKLSAHGYEVARLVTETEIAGSAYRVHYSFRSDGHIMRRLVGLDVHTNETDPARRRHDFGWKLYKRLADRKRETVRRQKSLAHVWSVGAERRGTLVDFTMTGGPHA